MGKVGSLCCAVCPPLVPVVCVLLTCLFCIIGLVTPMSKAEGPGISIEYKLMDCDDLSGCDTCDAGKAFGILSVLTAAGVGGALAAKQFMQVSIPSWVIHVSGFVELCAWVTVYSIQDMASSSTSCAPSTDYDIGYYMFIVGGALATVASSAACCCMKEDNGVSPVN
jgi:hypothetical protein